MQITKQKIIMQLPLIFGIMYLAATYALFLWGPIDWPATNKPLVTLFMAGVALCLIAGYHFGSQKQPAPLEFTGWRPCFWIGAIAGIILLFPNTYINTGRWPWQVFQDIECQNVVYTQMLTTVSQAGFGRLVLYAVRTLFAPFTFAVLPFGLLYWRQLRPVERALLFTHVACIILSSLMRGTDKEIGDLFITVLTVFFVVTARDVAVFGRRVIHRRAVISMIGIIGFLIVATSLFVVRKEQRLRVECESCKCARVIREDSDTSLATSILLRVRQNKSTFAYNMGTYYLAQGYYGLSLALHADFQSTYGIGHSQFMMTVLAPHISPDFYKRSYLYKISQQGWSDKTQWVSIFPWIASDVSFLGALVVMLGFGYVWARVWRHAVWGQNNAAVIALVYLTIAVLFFSANNQVAMSPDSYFSSLTWLLVVLCQTFIRKNLAGNHKRTI